MYTVCLLFFGTFSAQGYTESCSLGICAIRFVFKSLYQGDDRETAF